jgi:hypothetical protein
MVARVSRELGRPCRLHCGCRLGARLTNSRLIHGSRPEPVGTNRGRNGGNRQAKETKCGEMDGKESECPIVAPKRGNGPYRTPWSEGGAALWTQRRNHAEGIEPHRVSPRGNGSCEGQRHNVTSRTPLTGTSGSVGDLGWATTQGLPGLRSAESDAANRRRLHSILIDGPGRRTSLRFAFLADLGDAGAAITAGVSLALGSTPAGGPVGVGSPQPTA